ncbi:hypothetical protein HG531_010771 [Fusarium graminearum]|nr:hypothetical protein HG531_010771 [Fusarium graminearum]
MPGRSLPTLSLRLNRLRVAEQVLGIVLGLDSLQLGNVASPVRLGSAIILDLRVRVVGVHTPSSRLERVGDALPQALDEVEAIRGVLGSGGNAVVELEEEEGVTVDVGGVAGLGLGDGGVCAAGDVHLQPPRVAAALAGGGDEVDEGLEFGEGQRGGCKTAGVEIEKRLTASYEALVGLTLTPAPAKLQSLPQAGLITDISTINAVSVLRDTHLHGDLGRHALSKLLEVIKTLGSCVLIPVEADVEVGDLLRCSKCLELELDNNTKVCAGATDTPEEIGVLGLGAVNDFAGGENDCGADHKIKSEAVLAGDHSVASVKGVTTEADSSSLALVPELSSNMSKASTRLDFGGAVLGQLDAVHSVELNHEMAIFATEA